MKTFLKSIGWANVVSTPQQEEQKTEVMVQEKEKTNYPSIVEEIHNSFSMEAERMADEAMKIINSNRLDKKLEDKAELAKKFGFNNTKEVNEYQNIKSKLSVHQNVLEAVMESIEYIPTNKWIPEDSVKRICEKYNLVFGSTSQYKGFLPLKNLKEIEDFSNNYRSKFDLYLYSSIKRDIGGELVVTEEITKEYYESKSNWQPGNDFRFDYNNTLDYLKICAPIKDMDTINHKLVDGWKLEKNIPDPIVLARKSFKGIKGYYIVTAWGDESNDEEVKGYNNG